MSEKIKVLHIIKSLGRGGAEMLLPETLKLHDQSRFEFHYIYFLPWKNQLVDTITQAGGKVHCFHASNNISIFLKSGAVANYVKANRIELIHCHLPWAGIVGRRVFSNLHIPVIYTEHNKQERYHFLTRWINRLTFNSQTATIAVSGDVADSIKKNINPSIPVHEIVNGVNTDFFQRDVLAGLTVRMKLEIPEDAIVVGTLAVFRFQKRLKEWLDVFKKAADKNPRLYGIVVGDGPLRKEIEEHCTSLNLNHRIFMPGLQTDVKPWYSAMDVFMMSSMFEGLPIALLEAMSMQCTIVTTNAGGVKQVIQDKINGRVVQVEAWQELSNTLIEVIGSEDTRIKLSKAARNRVIEDFSLKRMVEELEKLYVSFTL